MKFRCTWLSMIPVVQRERKDLLANLCLMCAFLLVLGQLHLIRQSVREASEAAPSPVSYIKLWAPERRTYYPGDMIRFSVERSSAQDERDLIVLALDTFENRDTGETYPGLLSGRVLRKGLTKTTVSRQLPPKMSPGHYVLTGWVAPQTSRRTMPTHYESEPFTVAPKPQE